MRVITAIIIVAIGVAAFYVDATYYENAGVAFIGKTLFDITNWLAFWR